MTAPGTDLLFLRHAETDLKGTFCGHADPPLNAAGRAQLPAMLDRLAPFALHAVYCSDLCRALETAHAIAAAHHAPCTPSPALREIAFGAWEGLDWEAIEQRDHAFATRWVSEFPALPTPGGELITHFRQRVLTAVEELRAAAADRSIAVVTHAGVLRVVLEEFGHLAPHHAWERTRDYTCMLHFRRSGPHGSLEFLG